MSRPILFFDGVCNLCNGAVQFIMRHDSAERFQFAPLRSEVARPHLKQVGLPADYLASLVLVDETGHAHTGADAALTVGARLDAPWRWLATAGRVAPEWIRKATYQAVAQSRYHVFGQEEACRIPTPGERARFLDCG